jgi:colicin import membrane protein
MAKRTAASERLGKESVGLKKAAEGEMTTAEKAARRLEGVAKGQAKALEKTGAGEAKKVLGAGEKAASLEQRLAENAAKAAEAQAKKKAGEVAGQTKTAAKQAEAAAKPEAGKVLTEAKATASKVRAEATAKVEAMTKSGTAVESVESMINNEKDLSKLVEVGKVLHGVPGGKQMWADSVARVVTKKSPTQLGNWWETRGRDVAKAGGATQKQIAELDLGVQEIMKAANPKLAESMKKRLSVTMARAMGAVMGAGVVSKVPGGDSEE